MKKTFFLLFFFGVTPLFGADNYSVVDPFNIEPTRWRHHDGIILLINGLPYASVPVSFMDKIDQKISATKRQGHHLQIWEHNVPKNEDNGMFIFSEEILRNDFDEYFADAGSDIMFTLIKLQSAKEIKLKTGLKRRTKLGDIPIPYKRLPKEWREGLRTMKQCGNVQYFKFAQEPLQNPTKYEGLPRDKVIVGS